MVSREELLNCWLEGKTPLNKLTRKQFIMKNSNLDEQSAMVVIDWIWQAGFDAGQEQAIKELK